MTTQPFVHLHCHSHYSLLDGASKIPDLVARVKSCGMNAVAITDHGNLAGAMEFYNTCRENEIKPILGFEAYVAPMSRTDRSASRMREASYHLTLLAMNQKGFQNLIKLSSVAFLEGFYYKPRIDKELLEAHSEGLICLTGCAAGELSNFILGERMDEAEKLTAWYHRVFGDRLYMEIQNCGLDIQKQCAVGTIDLARKMGLPLVATNDSHYVNQDDAMAQDVLLCVNTHTLRSDEKRMKMTGDQFFIRSPEQMYAAFPGLEEAVKITQEIADRVNIQLEERKHYPVFHPPEDKTDVQYLRELCDERLAERYGDDVTPEIRHRLEYELSVIEKMGYSSYFLIVWDFVRFAEENGIPCQARGSACGAIVAYLLRLSNVCPLKYDLLFERFLDPSRTEPPDIDIDFCRDRRQLVIDYTKQKYGASNVAQIGTYGTLKAKAAIRDVGRALGVPLNRVDEIAKMVPDELNIKLKKCLEKSPELKEQYDRDPQIHELIDIAIRLEGLARSAGTHAAGVVVADRDLSEIVPLQTISGKDDVVTQWDGPTVEMVGLLKMDFLGLRNLTILDKAVQNVKKHRGIDLDPVKLPLDDQETFALLQRGETKGIFQLESGGMRDLLTKMKPDAFADIIATSALYRPGPLEGGMVMTYVNCKHGREPVRQVHPIVDEVLAETYGVMVYQEQVMRILNRLGGIELSSAYRCIKAISKKKLKIIAKFREEFITGSKTHGILESMAVELFELIEKFAGYGFNKSHSTAYGAVAYQTAYLKAHYPLEFMAALLSCGMESSDRITEHIDDCRRMNIAVAPPSVNSSDVEFSVVDDHLSFGMGAIKGLGEHVVTAIVAERNANGPFRSIFDLTERVDTKILNKGALELLIKSGGLDCLGPNRAQHMEVVERAIQAAQSLHRDRQRGQMNLFGGGDDDNRDATSPVVLPDMPDWTHAQKLALEKEVFGFYLTSHPLTEQADEIAKFATHTTKELMTLDQNAEVVVGGMISSMKKSSTKKPSRNGHTRYLNFDLEDTDGVVRCIAWPEEYSRFGEKIKADSIYLFKARIDRRGREPNLIVNELMTLEEARKQFTKQIAIKFQKGLHSEQDIQRVFRILQGFPGRSDVVLVVDTADAESPNQLQRHVMTARGDLKVSCGPDLCRELEAVLGKSSIHMHIEQPKRSPPSRGTAAAG
ncbi:MAG: DNA polymerase III subunit alpha [Planctomycetaceae bacterium]